MFVLSSSPLSVFVSLSPPEVGSVVECLKEEHVNNNNYVSECLPDYSEYFPSGHTNNNTNAYVLPPEQPSSKQQQQQSSSTGGAVAPVAAVGTMMNTLSNATPVTTNFIDSK